MSLGRRKARLQDAASWVFNRMADVYDARPAYPSALVTALAELAEAREGQGRVADIGAGIGHLALPLAARGLRVSAIEPARAMLNELEKSARVQRVALRSLHGQAEAMPLESASQDLVIIADALHFFDRERAAREIARVLAPRGAIAIITMGFAPTPFMRDLVAIMESAAPRRPREVEAAIEQLAALVAVKLNDDCCFDDVTPVDGPTLERILRSISFIGPAMNAQRFAAFTQRVRALPHVPLWARTFRLRSGCKREHGRHWLASRSVSAHSLAGGGSRHPSLRRDGWCR